MPETGSYDLLSGRLIENWRCTVFVVKMYMWRVPLPYYFSRSFGWEDTEIDGSNIQRAAVDIEHLLFFRMVSYISTGHIARSLNHQEYYMLVHDAKNWPKGGMSNTAGGSFLAVLKLSARLVWEERGTWQTVSDGETWDFSSFLGGASGNDIQRYHQAISIGDILAIHFINFFRTNLGKSLESSLKNL